VEEGEGRMIYVKLYGAKRTCTNYVAALLSANFSDIRVLINVLGWKHGPHPKTVDWTGQNWFDPDGEKTGDFEDYKRRHLALITPELRAAVEARQIRYVVCAKHPYAWYLGNVRRWPNRDHGIAKMAALWNARYTNWLELVDDSDRATLVRYEDLLTDLDAELRRLVIALDITRKPGAARDPLKKVRPRTDFSQDWPSGGALHDRSYYTEERYRAEISPVVANEFAERLDEDLLAGMGYTLCR
jgi:hypothetical protein